MNRTERKCLIASATLHGLLVFVLLLAPAFLTSRPKEAKAGADFISAGAIEAALGGRSGGGVAAPPPQVQRPLQSETRETKSQPEPEQQPALPSKPSVSKNFLEARPESKKQFELKPVASDKRAASAAAAPAKKFDLKKPASTSGKKPSVSKPSGTPGNESNQRQQEWSTSVGELAKRVGRSGGGGVDIPVPGAGGGGVGGSGLGDYASLVRAVYDNAWVDPSDVRDESAAVTVVIVIGRSGAIISAKISSRSGNSRLDASVQKALDQVIRIPQPFPPDVREQQLSYTINFNLGNRRRLG